jgi:hypothetical protein
MDAQNTDNTPEYSRPQFWLWYVFLKLLEGIGWSIWLVSVLCVLTGLTNLFNNSSRWLKTGVWKPLTTYDVLRDLFPSWSWLHYPTDYFGAWQIVNGVMSLPFWLVISIVGLPFLGVGYVITTMFKLSAKDMMDDHKRKQPSTLA